MTCFRLTGHFGKRLVFLGWEDGELVGDQEAVRVIRRLAAEGQTIWTPAYNGPLHNHLAHLYQAYQLMKMVLRERRPEMAGNLPPIPPPPPGAIA